MPHTRSKLTLSYSIMHRSSSQPALRSQYSAQSLPSYYPRPPTQSYRRPATRPSPPSYDDLMRTVDYRFIEQPPRYRSSFALSDIWEEDEEFEVSSILPNSPEYEDSIQLARRRNRFSRRVVAFLHSLRFKLQRNGARLVTNIGADRRIDLLA